MDNSVGAGNDSLLDKRVINNLRLLTAADPDFLSELIDIYIVDTLQFLATIRMAIIAHNVTWLRQSIHTLKGSSASIGARTIASLCHELEVLSDPDCMAAASEVLQRIEAEYERVKCALDAERHKQHAL